MFSKFLQVSSNRIAPHCGNNSIKFKQQRSKNDVGEDVFDSLSLPPVERENSATTQINYMVEVDLDGRKSFIIPGIQATSGTRPCADHRDILQLSVDSPIENDSQDAENIRSYDVFLVDQYIKDGENLQASSEVDPTAISTAGRTCLHTYLDFMFCVGTTTFRRKKRTSMVRPRIKLSVLYICHKVYFCGVALMSTLYSVQFVKKCYFYFLGEKSKANLIDLGYAVVILFIKCYATYFLGIQATSMSKVLKTIDKYLQHIRPQFNFNPCFTSFHWLAFLLGNVTLLAATLKTLFTMTTINEWSFENWILDHSEGVADAAFAWSTESYNNITIATEYGSNLTATTVSMGIFGIVMEFCDSIKLDTVRDMIVMTAVVLEGLVSLFINEIRKVAEAPLTKVPEVDPAKMEKDWNTYRKLKDVVDETASSFNTILKLMHIGNLFLFGFFFASLMEDKPSGFILGTLFYGMWKAAHAYYVSSKTFANNETCRKWIRNVTGRTGWFQAGGSSYSAVVLLDELDKEEIGFGKGSFLLGESFMFRFIGLAGSLSLLLVDAANEK